MLTLYRKKLLIRGWAGKTSPAEKAYQRAHAPWATREGGGAALAAYRKASTNTVVAGTMPAEAGLNT